MNVTATKWQPITIADAVGDLLDRLALGEINEEAFVQMVGIECKGWMVQRQNAMAAHQQDKFAAFVGQHRRQVPRKPKPAEVTDERDNSEAPTEGGGGSERLEANDDFLAEVFGPGLLEAFQAQVDLAKRKAGAADGTEDGGGDGGPPSDHGSQGSLFGPEEDVEGDPKE